MVQEYPKWLHFPDAESVLVQDGAEEKAVHTKRAPKKPAHKPRTQG